MISKNKNLPESYKNKTVIISGGDSDMLHVKGKLIQEIDNEFFFEPTEKNGERIYFDSFSEVDEFKEKLIVEANNTWVFKKVEESYDCRSN